MSERYGFITLPRSFVDSRWYSDGNTARVFLHLLLTANYGDHDFQGVTVHRGEVVATYPALADALHITARQARTALGHLKASGSVSVTQHSKFSVISILSWDMYQGGESVTESGKSQSQPILESPLKKEDKKRSSCRKRAAPVFEAQSEAYRASQWLSRSILSTSPNTRPHDEKTLQRWAADFDKLHRLDGYEWELISDVLLFAREDAFWKQNILSGQKFRQQFPVLVARYDSEGEKNDF